MFWMSLLPTALQSPPLPSAAAPDAAYFVLIGGRPSDRQALAAPLAGDREARPRLTRSTLPAHDFRRCTAAGAPTEQADQCVRAGNLLFFEILDQGRP